jgi:DNA-binding NarL/FixJ family response regulator
MPELKTMRVLIAEDHALVRQGMAALLSMDVGEVVEACDGEEALSLLKDGAFDLALIDIGLPRRTGLDVLREARRREWPLKVIILTGDTDHYSPADVYAAGADGFLYKTADADHFMAIVLAVAKGQRLPAQQDQDGEQAQSVAQMRDSLTARELQIIKLVTEGGSNKQAADILCISEHTIRKHREHINKKLVISSPTALAAFAIKAGLI